MNVEVLTGASGFIPGLEDPRVFRANLTSGIRSIYEANGHRIDAAGSAVVAEMVEHRLAELLRDDFRMLYADRYVPSGSFGVPAFADTYKQTRITQIGTAAYVESEDMPEATLDSDENRVKVHMYGTKCGWMFHELEAARLGQMPLDVEKQRAARDAVDYTRETILISGDAGLVRGPTGLITSGLVNNPLVDVLAVADGAAGTPEWSTKTATEILTDVTAAFTRYRANTEDRYMADTLLLPREQYAIIEQTPIGDNADKTIRTYLLENIPELQTIERLPQLAGAGAAATDRAILYRRSPEIVRAVIPMSARFLAPHVTPFRTTMYMVERNAGVEFIRPLGALYIDEI